MGRTRFIVRLFIVFLSSILLWLCIKQWNSGDRQSSSIEMIKRRNGSIKMKEDYQRVVVGVYYEALCPDSKSYVLRQLEPTYKKLKDQLIIQLIPYGKAKTENTPDGPKFDCQHGPTECEANMIHACSIEVLRDQSLVLNYISCMIERNFYPRDIAISCGRKLDIDHVPILECVNDHNGPQLLEKYGHMTSVLNPPMTFVPTITLDYDRMEDDQPALLRDLLGEVCKRFTIKPTECS